MNKNINELIESQEVVREDISTQLRAAKSAQGAVAKQ